MELRNQIRPGMVVRTTAGDKLGKVARIDENQLIIEKGLLFKKDCAGSLDRIVSIDGDEVIYDVQDTSEERPERAEREAAMPAATAETAATAEPAARSERASDEEIRIPLVEEQLRAEKYVVHKGAVRVRKEVVTEEKQITVPVTREEVVVERVPAGEARADVAPQEAFQEKEIAVPVVEEEVRVVKQPVVKEEVRVRKQQYQEQRVASAEVRHEEAEIEDEQKGRAARSDETGAEGGYMAPGRKDET